MHLPVNNSACSESKFVRKSDTVGGVLPVAARALDSTAPGWITESQTQHYEGRAETIYLIEESEFSRAIRFQEIQYFHTCCIHG